MAKNALQIPCGIIELDSPFAKQIGFTSDGFDKDCYLWGVPDKNLVWLSLIISTRKGAFRALMHNIQKLGYKFRIPTPLGRMLQIGQKQGWKLKSSLEYGDYVKYLTNED